MYEESSYLELKEIVNADFKKEVIAFANTDGGEILVGVRKDGEVVGVANAEAEMERISNMIRDGIRPDLTPYTSIEKIRENGLDLIRVSVSRGERRPYHISDKGLRPSGVYIRHGVASAPASEELIRQMIKESDGTTFDAARALNQDLTFEYAEKYFASCGVSFTESNKRSLRLITTDGYYTNAAFLLSDQCEYSIKCAIYKGSGKTIFQDRREFFGSILQQIEDAYEYISLSNHLRSSFDGLQRIDNHDYPPYALREALLNSVVHRDYDYSGSTIINIYEDRIEFISLGGLVKGLTLTDIMAGVSQSRNTIIANVFYRLKLIESYGTGIRRIIEGYSGQPVQPTFVSAPASFIATLPSLNQAANVRSGITDKERIILQLIEQNESITRKDVETALQCSSFPANQLLNQMIQAGRIIRIGRGKGTKYVKK